MMFLWDQVMVTNVTSLLKTVKAVEDEATKGTRALEATIEHIKQELAVRDTLPLNSAENMHSHLNQYITVGNVYY